MSKQSKITDKTKLLCDEIKQETGETQVAILEKATISYHRKIRMKKLNKAFAKLKEDPVAWKSYQEEQAQLDGTLADGIEQD